MAGLEKLTYNTLNTGNMEKINRMLEELFQSNLAAPDKDADDEIRIVASGQSNIFGYHPLAAGSQPESNPNVLFWQEDLEEGEGNYAWMVPDHNEDRGFVVGQLHVGVRGGGAYSAVWQAANLIQRASKGKRVKVLLVGKGGTGFGSGWYGPAEGPVAAELIAQHAAAFGSAKADYFIWCQGEFEATINSLPTSYLRNIQTLWTNLVAEGVIDANKTQMGLVDIGDSFGTWSGVQVAGRYAQRNTFVVSTDGREEIGGHYTSPAQLEIGRDLAIRFLSGYDSYGGALDRSPAVFQHQSVRAGAGNVNICEAYGGHFTRISVDVVAVADDGSASWTGKIQAAYATDGAATYVKDVQILSESGAAGFSVATAELYGPHFYCLFLLMVPAGNWVVQSQITYSETAWPS